MLIYTVYIASAVVLKRRSLKKDRTSNTTLRLWANLLQNGAKSSQGSLTVPPYMKNCQNKFDQLPYKLVSSKRSVWAILKLLPAKLLVSWEDCGGNVQRQTSWDLYNSGWALQHFQTLSNCALEFSCTSWPCAWFHSAAEIFCHTDAKLRYATRKIDLPPLRVHSHNHHTNFGFSNVGFDTCHR